MDLAIESNKQSTSNTIPSKEQTSQASYAMQRYGAEYDRYQKFLVVGPQNGRSESQNVAEGRPHPGFLVRLPGQQRGVSLQDCCVLSTHTDMSCSGNQIVDVCSLRCCRDDL